MTHANQAQAPERAAYTLKAFGEAFSVSRMTIWREVKAGRLKTYYVGRRVYVSAKDAEAWQRRCVHESSPEYATAQALDMQRLGLKPSDYTPKELARMGAAS